MTVNECNEITEVAIHNKNGKGLLQSDCKKRFSVNLSQSTIKMEKGYYSRRVSIFSTAIAVAIHNKNGKGLLLQELP